MPPRGDYSFAKSKPELTSKSGVFERLNAPKPCQRFLQRGNKPVTSTNVDQVTAKAQDTERPGALVPYGLDRDRDPGTELANQTNPSR